MTQFFFIQKIKANSNFIKNIFPILKIILEEMDQNQKVQVILMKTHGIATS